MKPYKSISFLLTVFLLSILFCLRYFQYIFNSDWIFYSVDTNALLVKLIEVQSLKEKNIIPYWMDNIGGGVGMSDQIMSAFFDYPLFFFDILKYEPGIVGLRSLTIVALIHFFIHLINTLVLSKSMGFANWTSLILGSLYLLLLNSEACARWTTIPCAYAWFPLLLSGFIQLIRHPQCRTGIICICISVWGFTVNPLQPFISVIIFSVVFIISWILFAFNNFKKNLPHLIVSGLISAFIMAVAIIPGFLNSSKMLRIVDGKLITGNSKISFEEQKSFIYDWADLNYIIDIPSNFYLGFPVGHPYLNLILILLSIGGVIILFRFPKDYFVKEEKWIYLFLFALCSYLMISLYDSTYISTRINASLPLFNKIRQPLRNAFIFQTGFLILSGLFVNTLFRRSTNSEAISTNVIKISIQVILLITSVFYFYRFDITWIVIPFILMSLIFIWRKKTIVLLIQFIVLVIFLLLNNPHPYSVDKGLIKKNLIDYKNKKSVLSNLTAKVDFKNYRIKYDYKKYSPWTQVGSHYNLRSLQGGFHPYIIPQYYQMNWIKHPKYNALLGEKYRLSDKNEIGQFEKIIGQFENHYLFENSIALPYAFLSNSIELNKSNSYFHWNKKLKKDSFADQLLDGKLFLDNQTFEKITPNLNNSRLEENLDIKIEHINQNLKVITLKAKQNSILVLNEYFGKNWTVTTDGKLSEIFKVNLNQIGTYIPKGTSEVKFVYKSTLTYLLLMVHRIGLLLLLLLICFTIFQKWLKPKV